MRNVLTRLLSLFGAAADHTQLVDELDQQLWLTVRERIVELGSGELNGYVWARARATGLLPAADSTEIVAALVQRFVTRLDQRSAMPKAA